MKWIASLVVFALLGFAQTKLAAAAPVFSSVPTASTAVPLVGQTIFFTVAATDPQNLPIVFIFNYGDGSSDLLGSHVYKSPGAYTVLITASNCNEETTTSIPLTVKGFANLWIKKQAVKLGVDGKESWQAQFIYNADRTTAGIFNANEDVFIARVGTIPPVQVDRARFEGSAPKFSFKSAKGFLPVVSATLDESAQTISVSSKVGTFADTVPAMLPNLVQLGDSTFSLDASFDAKGKFTANSGYASVAFVVASGKVKIKTSGKDTAQFSLLLGDPAFLFPGASTAATVRFRLSNSVGTTVIDKDFTSITAFAGGKFKTAKDVTSPAGKFSYDSAKGKMSVAISKASLASLLTNSQEHVGVDITLGDQTYSTCVTLFAPKSGSYSTTMGKGTVLVPGTTGNLPPGPPQILLANPIHEAIDVSLNQKITATFSEAMDAPTITTTTFTLQIGTTPVAGTVTLVGKTAVFVPAALLTVNSMYSAIVTTGVKDMNGNPMARNYVWCFTTGATVDVLAPTVLSTQPGTDATGVAINQSINATFSEAMAPSTLNSTTFTLTGPNQLTIAGLITYDSTSNIASFKPSAPLAENTTYAAAITTGAEDRAGNALAANYTWNFSTGAQVAQPEIVLGSAGNFAILAGSTVTSTGATVINGDLGVSPGSAVTGFPPGIVNGAMHISDNTAVQAKNDLLAAYNDGAARLNPAVLPGNLGGLTLTPGLYKNSSSTGITGTGPLGILTLDAQGDPNAVFIFQMGSTLTTDPGTQIVLSGGAKAANIYWQVGSSATFGTTSVFKGNVLADQSITLNTGATLDGRALTRIGAVSLDASTVNKP